MKGGNSGHNESELDMGNILKPTFDTLTEEGRKAFKVYRVNPSPSLNDVQNMINSALERQAKSTDKL
jgi:hypothetical protein